MIENAEWKFLSMDSKVHRINYTFQSEKFSEITYTLIIQRRTVFHLINVVFPGMVIAILVGMTFTLPPLCGERIGFCVTNLLTVLLFSLTISDRTPPSAEVPIITKFLSSVFISAVAAMGVTCFSINYSFLSSNEWKELPWIFRVLTNRYLARIVCMKDNVLVPSTVSYTNDVVEIHSKSQNNAESHGNAEGIDNKPVEECYEYQWRRTVKVWDRLFLFLYVISLAGTFLDLYLSVDQFIVM